MKKSARLLIASLLLLAVTLMACNNNPAPQLAPEEQSLFSDMDFDSARLSALSTPQALNLAEATVLADGPEVTLEEAMLSSQATLAGATGFIAYANHNPNITAAWRVFLADQANDTVTLVYRGRREIQSVAVTADGNTMLLSMRTTNSDLSPFAIWQLTLDSGNIVRLTDDSFSGDQTNVSMSADGNSAIWETSFEGNRALILQTVGGMGLASIPGRDLTEPSLSGDGMWTTFVERQGNRKSVMVLAVAPGGERINVFSLNNADSDLLHPSISDNGVVVWLQYSSNNSDYLIRSKGLNDSTIRNILRAAVLEHPFIGATGELLTYGDTTATGVSRVMTRNLLDNTVVRTSSNPSPVRNFGMVWAGAAIILPEPDPISISGTVTVTNISMPSGTVSSESSSSRAVADIFSSPASAADLLAQAQADGMVKVIVMLNTPFVPEAELSGIAAEAQQASIARTQNSVLANLRVRNEAVVRYSTLPLLALEVDESALRTLLADPNVAGIYEDALNFPHMQESLPIIGAPAAWDLGFDGSNWSVAVLDTGVEAEHPFFGGRVVAEACFSTTGTSGTSTVNTLCPNGTNPSGVDSQIGPGAAAATRCQGLCDHGTHVAGTVAGDNGTQFGVAKAANIIGVQVFSRITSSAGANSVGAYNSNIISGLEFVNNLSQGTVPQYAHLTLNIASANMSLGGGNFTANCDTQEAPRKAAIDSLRARNIATVISSGNSYSHASMGAPACISTAVSIGSTFDGSNNTTADDVSDFSSSASFLSLLAPGEMILSSVGGGGYANFRGTSMAAPHVAGAWAVLRHKYPNATVSEILNLFTTTGTPVRDAKNNIVKPRIDVLRALNNTPAPAAVVRVRLYDSATGNVVAETTADGSNVYSFTNVTPGSYYINAFQDVYGYGIQNATELAGFHGSAAVPSALAVTEGAYTADITIGRPTELEPNDSITTNNLLLRGAVLTGNITAGNVDFFRLEVPAAGSYTIRTYGACRGAGLTGNVRLDNAITLFDSEGVQLANEDQFWCSRITYDFPTAGTYFVRVRGYGTTTAGNYHISFR